MSGPGRKNGPGTVSRAGPPSLRDARESIGRGRRSGEEKGGNPATCKGLCADSRLTEAEPRLQPCSAMRLSSLAASRWSSRSSLSTGCSDLARPRAAPPAAVVRARAGRARRPRRRRCGWSGAWRLTPSDPRFGGLSALAIDGGELLALTDSGVVAALCHAVAPRCGRCADRAICPTGRATPAQAAAATAKRCLPIRRARLVGRRSRIAIRCGSSTGVSGGRCAGSRVPGGALSAQCAGSRRWRSRRRDCWPCPRAAARRCGGAAGAGRGRRSTAAPAADAAAGGRPRAAASSGG